MLHWLVPHQAGHLVDHMATLEPRCHQLEKVVEYSVWLRLATPSSFLPLRGRTPFSHSTICVGPSWLHWPSTVWSHLRMINSCNTWLFLLLFICFSKTSFVQFNLLFKLEFLICLRDSIYDWWEGFERGMWRWKKNLLFGPHLPFKWNYLKKRNEIFKRMFFSNLLPSNLAMICRESWNLKNRNISATTS